MALTLRNPMKEIYKLHPIHSALVEVRSALRFLPFLATPRTDAHFAYTFHAIIVALAICHKRIPIGKDAKLSDAEIKSVNATHEHLEQQLNDASILRSLDGRQILALLSAYQSLSFLNKDTATGSSTDLKLDEMARSYLLDEVFSEAHTVRFESDINQEPNDLLFVPVWADSDGHGDFIIAISRFREMGNNSPNWEILFTLYYAIIEGANVPWALLNRIILTPQGVWRSPSKARDSLLNNAAEQVISNKFSSKEINRYENAVATLKRDYEQMSSLSTHLQGKLEKVTENVAIAFEQIQNVQTSAIKSKEILTEQQKTILEEFSIKLESAIQAATDENVIKEPVELWKTKQIEHSKSSVTARCWFISILVVAAILVVIIAGSLVSQTETFLGISKACLQGNNNVGCVDSLWTKIAISTAVMTILTLLLWLARLQMKIFLSERHLAMDARERMAFAQSYVGLVRLGDTSNEAQEQRSIVYSALFRPSSDGIVREEGGLDPSIAAAVSKLLSR